MLHSVPAARGRAPRLHPDRVRKQQLRGFFVRLFDHGVVWVERDLKDLLVPPSPQPRAGSLSPGWNMEQISVANLGFVILSSSTIP